MLAIILGLVIGKPVGIFAAAKIAIFIASIVAGVIGAVFCGRKRFRSRNERYEVKAVGQAATLLAGGPERGRSL